MINSQQRIRLVTEFQRTESIGMSALKSGMDRKTARKYLKHPERLGEPRPAREWRTRVDPLTAIWQVAEPRLRAAPELEAKVLFEHLLMIRPEQMREAQLRTLQRRVRHDRLVRDYGISSGELEYLRLLKLTAELDINAVEGLLGGDAVPRHLAVAGRHLAGHTVSTQPRGTGGTGHGFKCV